MQSKDLCLKNYLAEKGKFDYTEDDFKAFKKAFLDSLWILKDKEKALKDAYKIVFGGEKQ